MTINVQTTPLSLCQANTLMDRWFVYASKAAQENEVKFGNVFVRKAVRKTREDVSAILADSDGAATEDITPMWLSIALASASLTEWNMLVNDDGGTVGSQMVVDFIDVFNIDLLKL